MHRLARLILLGGTLAALIGSLAGPASAANRRAVVGHIYVDDDTAGRNAVSGFDRLADGSLVPIPGTPFATGGAGIGSPTGSAGAIQRSADGRYLLAVDPASDDVSVLKVRPSDGSLRLVERVPSGGRTPISIAVHGSLVYVANAGAGGSSYAGFRLSPGGHLRPIAGSTVALPDTALPGQVLFSGDGHHLVGTRVGPSAGPSFIDSFVVGRDGRLTAAPGSPFPAQRIGPFGSQFRPTDPGQLFVSNAHDGPGLGSVSAYDVAADGTLTPVPGSPFADFQTAPCWVAISHDGSRLFTVNTAVSTISGFTIAGDGSLSLAGTTALRGAGLAPFDAALSPDDAFLYVVDAGTASISVLAAHGTSLTELAGSPFAVPGGGAPFGMVVD